VFFQLQVYKIRYIDKQYEQQKARMQEDPSAYLSPNSSINPQQNTIAKPLN